MVLAAASVTWGFSREGAPDPTGLLYGLSGVAVGQVAVIAYYSARRLFFQGELIQTRDHVEATLGSDLLEHLSQPEGFLMLGTYLAATWLLRIMPDSYYNLDAPVNWTYVVLQLLLQDFLMYAMHLLQHKISAIYKRGHKPHHFFRSPKLCNAFNGSVTDTLVMILIPLMITAQVLHVEC